jgi:glycosyltransferase involved in cell wall biosynthesis
MRILLLTQILPYPPDAGPRVKTLHTLKDMLKRGFDVTLVSYVREYEKPYLPVLRSMCEEVITVPIRRSWLRDLGAWIRGALTGRPFLIVRDDSSDMQEIVKAIIRAEDFDILYADQITMTQFAMKPGTGIEMPFRIFDAHNATWMIVDRMRKSMPRWLQPALALETHRMKKYEGEVIRRFEQTLAVTKLDRKALLYAAGIEEHGSANMNTIMVVPITIDAEDLKPANREIDSLEILTLGSLNYRPNADGIVWFLREVFPHIHQEIPGVRLTIIGKDPPQDLQGLAKQWPGSVEVTGYVRTIAPYFERASLVIVPVLAGSGMRVRILESLARGMPVVTTTIGLEGIKARPGVDVVVADTPFDFASSVIDILMNARLRDQLGKNGRELAANVYDWRVALRDMDAIYLAAEKHRDNHPLPD